MKKYSTANKNSYKNRLNPNSPVENNQSRKASIDNENYNLQGQGDKDNL